MGKRKGSKKKPAPVPAKTGPSDRQIEYVILGNADCGGTKGTLAVQLYLLGMKPPEIAKRVGMAQNSVYRALRDYREKPSFRERVGQVAGHLPEMYLTQKKLEVLRYHDADQRALEEYEKNPEALLRFPQYMKMLKQSANVMPDDKPKVLNQTFNIDAMQKIISGALEVRDDDTQDAEIVDQIEDKGGK